MDTTNNSPRETPRQNRLIASLARECREHLLDEKWLLAPSRRVGQQWLDSVARAGQPVVNVHLFTVSSLAVTLAGPSLAADRRTVATALGREVLCARLLRAKAGEYLGRLAPSLAMAQRLAASLRDLRLAGLQPDDLARKQFEVPAKGRELLDLFRAYQRALDDQQLVDEADVLLRATDALPAPAGVRVLAPADLELTDLERRLLDAIKPVVLPVDESPTPNFTDTFKAVGESSEVREVLRHCLANGWPLDQVEILHTDAATYVPLLYELTEQLEMPTTFAEGIPVRYSRPGRALAAWWNWITENFPQPALVAMIRDGLLANVPAAETDALRVAPIGFGRDRYLPYLKEATALRALLDISEPTLRTAAEFLQKHARGDNELDNFARDELLSRITELSSCLDPVDDGAEWVPVLLRETRVLGLGPRPGHLHVAGLRSGGHSGRPHTFLVGLDSNRFPPAGRQDPVVLDSERHALSQYLSTSAQDRERSMKHFQRLRARLRGTVTASHSCRDVGRAADQYPGLAELATTTVAALAPQNAEDCLSEVEWWLWRLCHAAPVQRPTELVGERFPWLGRGLHAAAQRASSGFTEYDGAVLAAGPNLDPASAAGRSVSPSRMETFGACPLRFFYKYALELREPDELVVSPNAWLLAVDFGNLMHDVFHHLVNHGGKPQKILEEHAKSYREQIPPLNEGVYRRDLRRLEAALRAFEAELKLARGKHKTEVEIEGVPIELPGGAKLFVRGRIDRVDDHGETVELWDYKSGSPSKYEKKPPFNGGRILQHAIYIALATAHYRKPVERFCYFFPTEKGRGDKVCYTPEELKDAPALLAELRAGIAEGKFHATTNAEDCRTCDFNAICRDVATITAQSAHKQCPPPTTTNDER